MEEFAENDVVSLLAAIGQVPEARELFDVAITEMQEVPRPVANRVELLIIGGGLHAAIFASTYYRLTGVKPLVIEERDRTGGIFDLAERETFFLNSRNRREGNALVPGTEGPLNTIVNGYLQPSMMSGLEYQTNVDMAFPIRVNLALCADVITGMPVTSLDLPIADGDLIVNLGEAAPVEADNVIIATGVGEPKTEGMTADRRVITFNEFLQRFGFRDDPFPLQGLNRVAVVGAKDSGNVVVEYLLGQGPTTASSVAALDYVERIDWYDQKALTKEAFEDANRSRYKGIGRYMPRVGQDDYYYRVQPIPGKVIQTFTEDGGVRVRTQLESGEFKNSELVYDLVVFCIGFNDQANQLLGPPEDFEDAFEDVFNSDLKLVVAKKLEGVNLYKVGPCADLQVTDQERIDTPVLGQIPENSAAVFRYADSTAKLCEMIVTGDV